MNKKTIITMMLALVTMTGLAQTKTATITGYSPAMKDGTLALAYVGDNELPATIDAVQNGRFSLTVPVEEFTKSYIFLEGEGSPNSSRLIWLSPGVTVKMTGNDYLIPIWKVESPIPEQQTEDRLIEPCRDVLAELLKLNSDRAPWEKRGPVEIKRRKMEMDILPSLPVDAASINKLEDISIDVKSINITHNNSFPYMEQLKELEKSMAARAPKGFEEQLAEIHANIYPPHVLQVGEEIVDVELFDMRGEKHHLAEFFGQDNRYVLLDFWNLGCGPCIQSEPEIREVYEKMKGKLEIISINDNNLSAWQNHAFSKRIVWKNWNDGKKGKGINSLYCDINAWPYFVLISPDKRIVWKGMGYIPGSFMGLAEGLNGPKQDNTSYLSLAIRKVDASASGTTVSFRYYSPKIYGFGMSKGAYLEANGKKYRLTAADGIKLDETNYTQVKASEATEGFLKDLFYTDFTLTFEPFDTIPSTFDFKEGDEKGDFVVRHVSLE